ncbi:membrane protein [Calothrix sp. 336/3]|nr:membrane protein [Calothrix sp. 336/3]
MLTFPLADVQGELAALGAAGLWAIASVVYGRLGASIPPLQLNLCKGVVAIALLLFTIAITGQFFPHISLQSLSLLILSGMVGIGLGDTAFFATINTLGARQALLMETLAPPITAILALAFLNETLNSRAWCGILLTIIGVGFVVTERTSQTVISRKSFYKGILFGLLAAIAAAIAAVLSRAAFAQSDINPLWAALIRLVGGVLILIIWGVFSPSQERWQLQRLQSTPILTGILFAAFCGTYLGIWLQQIALKLTAAGIASTLLQTSPVLIIPIAIYLGEKVTWRAIAGVCVAIIGVGFLFYLR